MNASDRNNSRIIATTRTVSGRVWRSRSIAMLVGLVAAVNAASAAPVDIAPSPLFLGNTVPGTLVLTPSVEWPTGDSIANINAYIVAKTYVGYFDSEKCYAYNYDAVEANRYFYPVGAASSHVCATSPQWSGNFLDWAGTQTIDPFRKALTGGYRITDTTTTTILQKARQDGQGSNADRTLTTKPDIIGATPAKAGWTSLQTRLNGLGYLMYFTRTDSRPGGSPLIDDNPPSILIDYNPGDANQMKPTGKYTSGGSQVYDNRIYAVSMRVKVCVSGMLELDCKAYGSNYKPEGLIQQYSDKIRYSIFGYLNDTTETRDGAALRANQKFVGPLTYDPIAGTAANTQKEWDPTTGVLIQNPNPADVTATNSAFGTSIADSGVINYVNKFGELNTNNRKGHDPVSEMYYAAIRYLKNQDNVPAYTSMSGATVAAKNQYTDGFPVITTWDDPVKYSCQSNAILGIGDVNTWDDKNLPSATGTGTTSEPAKPSQVSSDTTVDVKLATAKVAQLEGITINNNPFTGRNNSAYMVGLAYDSHTKDMRADFPGLQTVSTYWSDVQENQVLLGKAQNQYYLTGKYGGFRVPSGYDPYAQTAALPQSWWHASTDVLSTGDLRPDNFYTAGDAAKMVQGLEAAFAQIVSSIQGTGASFGASSTSLQNGTTLFQSTYFSNSWYGDLTAYALDPSTGAVLTPSWSASSLLATATWSARKIYINNGTGVLVPFTYANLSPAEKTVLGSSTVVDFLHGDRSNEQPSGALRTRTNVLGDIVDSQPIYVGPPNGSLYQGASFTGASTYQAFVTAKAARAAVVYVGSNDGMLHAFNATTGAEVFGFVPKAAITADLLSYATPGYVHRYSVDGEITVADTYVGGAWKTILVGTMGRGNPGVFALDVTDPSNPAPLWDKSAADIGALGNNLGKPIIAQVADNDWRVIFGNGPNSSAGAAQLVMVKLSDGSSTSVNLGGTNNALSAATIWDSDGDGFFDRAYAGDLLGNMWRIDGLPNSTPTTVKLLTATDGGGTAQPITAAPLVATQPSTTNTWVFFGTGRYLGTADLASLSIQTWYGLIDGGATISGRSQLVQRNITAEGASVSGGPIGRVIDAGTASDLTGKSGWYIDLISPVNGNQGERMVVPNIFLGLALIGVTRITTDADACSPGGSGFVMAINPFTGARLDSAAFDQNGDGVVNGADLLGGIVTSGIGLLTGGNGVIAVGERLYGTLDNGSQFTPPPAPSVKNTTRVNWHEVIGN